MDEYINEAAKFLRSHSYNICFAWTAALLVIFGSNLARFAKNMASTWHFVFRVIFFMIVCGFGYGILTVFVTRFLNQQLNSLSNIWVIIATLIAFFGLGVLADRKNQI